MADSTWMALLMVVSLLSAMASFMMAMKIQQDWRAYAKELLEFNEKMNRDWAEVLAKMEERHE